MQTCLKHRILRRSEGIRLCSSLEKKNGFLWFYITYTAQDSSQGTQLQQVKDNAQNKEKRVKKGSNKGGG